MARLLTGGRLQPDPGRAPEPGEILVGDDGRIARLLPPGTRIPDAEILDLAGRLVVPPLLDAHQHLDKSNTLGAVVNEDGTLAGAIAAFKRYASRMTREDVIRNAERTLAMCLARGTVAVRAHTNVDPEQVTRAVEAMVEVRERWKDRVRIQIVASMTGGAPARPERREWLHAALEAGADIIGGSPSQASDPEAFIDIGFEAAEKYGRPIDFHLDEHLDASAVHFDIVSERTRAHGMAGRVTASHACALSALDRRRALETIERMAAAGIAVITLPAGNLLLHGRDAEKLMPRGITRVAELLAAGVTVAAASDNIRDPFIPVGSGDLVETARWTLLAAPLGPNDHGVAWTMVGASAARIMGLAADYGLREGARADLLAVDAQDITDFVAGAGAQRAVFVGGQLVAGRLGAD